MPNFDAMPQMPGTTHKVTDRLEVRGVDAVQEWHCEPPANDVRYRVLRDAWDFDATPPTRHIFEVEPA